MRITSCLKGTQSGDFMQTHTQTGQIIMGYVERRQSDETAEYRESGEFVVRKVDFSEGCECCEAAGGVTDLVEGQV